MDRGMQECFRQHPDVYGAEIDDMDGDDAAPSTDGEQDSMAGARQEPEDLAKLEPEASKATEPKQSKRQPIKEEAKQDTNDAANPEPEASQKAGQKAAFPAEKPKQN